MAQIENGFKVVRKLSSAHDSPINRIAWSPDNRTLASTSYDRTIKLWDLTSKTTPPRTLVGHSDRVISVAWAPDGRTLATGSGDNQIRLWDITTGKPFGEALLGHSRPIFGLSWSPARNVLASASTDTYVGLWDVQQRKLISALRGHSGGVTCVSWSPSGRLLASGSNDHTIRVWDGEDGSVKKLYEGHAGTVTSIAWAPKGNILASASHDSTVRVWGKQNTTLEGHTDIVTAVSFSFDGRFLASKSMDGSVRIWDCETWQTVKILDELASVYWTCDLAFHPNHNFLATLGDEDQAIRIWKFDVGAVLREADKTEGPAVRYTNAKVVLVGDSGVGKSSLADVLRGKPFQPTESTHGRQVWRVDAEEHLLKDGVREVREIMLWDMAGQPGYRLIHQLHLNEVCVALVVFDVKSDLDPFSGVRHWYRALRNAQLLQLEQFPLRQFLIAARVDRGGVGVGQNRIDKIMEDLKFDGYFETSAKENINISDLNSAIRNFIDWDALPKVSSTQLFQKIKNFLNRVREQGRAKQQNLFSVDELYDTFIHTKGAPPESPELRKQFETCIGLVEAQGLIRHFNFSNLVLLQPEVLDAYASAMITAAKDEAEGMGYMSEQTALAGRFRMPAEERLKDEDQEQQLLIATIADLLRHEIALRDEDTNGVVHLVFPSQSSRTQPVLPEEDDKTVIFFFDGPVLNIYTTLAVRLWHTGLFSTKELYENAVTFEVQGGGRVRMYLRPAPDEEGRAELMLFFDDQVQGESRLQIEEYVRAHLMRRALPGTVGRRHIFVCPNPSCRTPVTELQVRKRREFGHDWINCGVCETRISLRTAESQRTPTRSLVRQGMVLKLDKEADEKRRHQMYSAVLQGKKANNEYDVFLCHNNLDKSRVQEISRKLETFGVLAWLDEYELEPGAQWEEQVEEKIEKCQSLAFFLGNNGVGKIQRQELEYARHYAKRIIPVLLPETRNPKMPLQLTGRTWVDFTKQRPPPIEHLVWGITGKRPQR